MTFVRFFHKLIILTTHQLVLLSNKLSLIIRLIPISVY